MKLFLGSFLQQENFGSGRVISITENGKPDHLTVNLLFKPFTPPKALVDKYNSMRNSNPKEAAELFVSTYTNQLEAFFQEITTVAQEENKNILELLPFEEGDTLASWERAEFTNYRRILAPFLEKMGYEINLK